MPHCKPLLFIIIAVLLTIIPPAAAQTTPPDTGLIPPMGKNAVNTVESGLEHETHPPLKLTPDKSELVRLGTEAASVVVGNPAHITVLLDTPTLAVVIPRKAGATYFSVIGKDGNVIMQRHVIVASPKKNYVRIRRSCGNAAAGQDCQPQSVYFCPDMCHEIEADPAQNARGRP